MEKIIAFNFKMNLDYNEIKEYVSNIKGKIKNKSFVFCPPESPTTAFLVSFSNSIYFESSPLTFNLPVPISVVVLVFASLLRNSFS